MNEALVKKITRYAVAGIIGGVTGYFIGKVIADYILDKEYEDALKAAEIEPDEPPFDPEPEPKPIKTEEGAKLNGKAKKMRVPTDYTQFAKDPHVENPDLIELAKKYVTVADEPEGPHIITVNEYAQTCDHYEKVPLTYYAIDGAVVYDKDELPVDDPDGLLGHAALVSFGQGSDDKDIVYIRNDRISKDFEITRVALSYMEVVGGELPDKQEEEREDEEDEEEEEEAPKPPVKRSRQTRKMKREEEDDTDEE